MILTTKRDKTPLFEEAPPRSRHDTPSALIFQRSPLATRRGIHDADAAAPRRCQSIISLLMPRRVAISFLAADDDFATLLDDAPWHTDAHTPAILTRDTQNMPFGANTTKKYDADAAWAKKQRAARFHAAPAPAGSGAGARRESPPFRRIDGHAYAI